MKICSRKPEKLEKHLNLRDVHSLLASLIMYQSRETVPGLVIGYLASLRQFNHINDFATYTRTDTISVDIQFVDDNVDSLVLYF